MSFILVGSSVAQSSVDSVKSGPAFHFEGSYIGDIVSNLKGGIKRGTTYLGLANIKGMYDTEIARQWKGGKFFVNVANTHGGQPSATLVGDFQGVSNIEAGDLTFMYELWFKQSFGKLELTLGLQDLNADFAVSDNGSIFTNGSFGIHSSISDNITAPIFPLTALGFNLQWRISDAYLWKNAVFDGTPDDYDTNPYNTHWKMSENQGFLAVTEFQVKKTLLAGKLGTYKLGAYYHQHNDSINVAQKNGGFYFVGDQQVSDRLSLFTQLGLNPKHLNKNNQYYSFGFNYTGAFEKRPNDQLGIAVANALNDANTVGSETTIELIYHMKICENVFLRPDIQYIINPAGAGVKLNNALVGFIRFGLTF